VASNLKTFTPPGAFVTHLIKNGFKRYGPVETVGDFEIHNLDLTSLKLDVGILTPFLIWKPLSGHGVVQSEQLAAVLLGLHSLTEVRQKKCFVLTIGGKLIRIDPPILEEFGLLGVAIMDRATMDEAMGTAKVAEKRRLLSAPLVKFLGRELLSPYVSGRPALGGRFFGRSSLVRRILPSAGNFTIIGNRRIGKTSLLKELKERLKLENVLTAEIYGATCSSTMEVGYKLLHALGLFREAEHLQIYPRQVSNLPAQIHRISMDKQRPVAIFIDELDHILEFDAQHGYELLHLLRETCEGNQHCRVFLAGFRKVMEVAQSFAAPLFNFTMPIELPLFNQEEAYEMVTTPLEHLGIQVSNTDLPDAVYRETGGHPELIQIHCAEIIRFVQAAQRVPTEADLLMNVFNTPEYKQKVLSTFLANIDPYEELLCYLLMSDAEQVGQTANYKFGPADVHRVLEPVGVSLTAQEITGVLTNLKVSGVISHVPDAREKYRFCAPRLISYSMELKLEISIKNALDKVMEQLRKAVAAKNYQSRSKRVQSDQATANEEFGRESLADERKLRSIERARPIGRPDKSESVKHIYLVPGGSAVVTQAEGVTTLRGAIDPGTVEDVNFRCLEMVDRWMDHKVFDQKLRGIGNQLHTALQLGIPELLNHLNPGSDSRQIVIASDGEGLKIPFELLPHGKVQLGTSVPLSRRITNSHLPANVQFPFQQLIDSLNDTSGTLRVLLVASDPEETLSKSLDELRAVRGHIEGGCRRMGLGVHVDEILPPQATSESLERELIDHRPFHVLHFTGHARHSSEDADASGIVLRGKNGQPEVISCKRLSRWLEGANLWLAYISSCHSAAASGSGTGLSQRYVGTVEAIVSAGVPNVVGFRWLVSDESALYLADEFYHQLFEVQPEKNLSLAMLEARRLVERRANYFDAWASSMLVTQS
jgi:CHAT domain-containing protein